MAFFFHEGGLTLTKINASKPLSKLELKKAQRATVDSILDQLKLSSFIYFNEDGKPLLHSGEHLSISNDETLCGIFRSDLPCGLDIQTCKSQIEKLKTKFCNSTELVWAKSLEELTTIWCIKEAIFKVFGTQVLFAASITTVPFHPNQSQLQANYKGVHGTHLFNLHRLQVDSTFVVYTQLEK